MRIIDDFTINEVDLINILTKEETVMASDFIMVPATDIEVKTKFIYITRDEEQFTINEDLNFHAFTYKLVDSIVEAKKWKSNEGTVTSKVFIDNEKLYMINLYGEINQYKRNSEILPFKINQHTTFNKSVVVGWNRVEVRSLGRYLPTDYEGHNLDVYTRRILDFKRGKPIQVDFFAKVLNNYLKAYTTDKYQIAYVPKKLDEAEDKFLELFSKLDKENNKNLVKFNRIVLKQTGLAAVEREINIKSSMSIEEDMNSEPRLVYILDDTTTTGASVKEVSRVLLDNGYEVEVITLGYTPRDKKLRNVWLCPKCNAEAIIRFYPDGRPFFACSQFPYTKCDFKQNL